MQEDQEGDPGQGREEEAAEGAPAWLAAVVGVEDGNFALDLDDLVKLPHLHGDDGAESGWVDLVRCLHRFLSFSFGVWGGIKRLKLRSVLIRSPFYLVASFG